MKVATQKSTSILPIEELENTHTLDDSLAICLFGFSRSMYVSEDEEEVRRRVIMSEVLPDEEMWAAWAKNEAPLRQGRGWYPALDRHFLELLVISEIHCLANPLNGVSAVPGTPERVHRHATRVRRVACERIGAERLHAYCDRVKEAFEAYMHGAWGAAIRGYAGSGATSESGEVSDGTSEMNHGEEEEERGRSRDKGEGSVQREVGRAAIGIADHGAEVDAHYPFGDDMAIDEQDDAEREVEGELLRIDLADVDEKVKTGATKVSQPEASERNMDAMDIELTTDCPQPAETEPQPKREPVAPITA